MEALVRLVRGFASDMNRTLHEGRFNSQSIDMLSTTADRVLRAFVMLLVVFPFLEADAASMQSVVHALRELSVRLPDNHTLPYGYYPSVCFDGTRGRPRIRVTSDILEYFFSHGFSASTTAMLLHVSLSTVRRWMSEYGMMIRDQYSAISDSELDRIVTLVQHRNPNCGYRMMQGYLRRMGHRIQQSRVRDSMIRIDPEGVLSRWCTAVQRRVYSVPSPNSLWHIEGNHRLIR